ncbi:helix-turn-helix domain-containing protein [Acinetobacter sp. ANC 4558]|uniref:helix-turn-helix domain-containing protein n=1 Tax=Acinetobacter sp. ANC 4558 TaxID=1977876 RepID=UPI000A353AE9|nr:helix-turn-helix domain-containing protein [Acinetobacter sp. ANC 4558]OTG86619.1 helix-turn-helix domain-containing protein [Acinetobacter sp. ANC 4558]
MEINPNSKQSTGVTTETNALGNVQRSGEYLRQVRLEKNIELDDVANEIKIPTKTLIALEQDDYASLPEATFIKGYYRIYAKYLNVDATEIIQRFDEVRKNDAELLPNHELNNSPIRIMGKLPGSNHDRNRKWLKRIGLIVVVIAILAALFSVVQNWTGKDGNIAETSVGANDVQVIAMDSDGAVSGDQLKLEFSRPTSINIIDSTGKVLATGRQSSTVNLSGETPFQIRLDDATAVTLSLNNEKISLSPYTVNGKAEFRLSR